MHDSCETVVGRLREIEARIGAVAREAGRDPAGVTLIAVTKTFGADEILPAIDAGHRTFGENRVQEAHGKWPALKDRYPDIQLHLIGPLQSNKTKEAVTLFDAIHSVDSPRSRVHLPMKCRDSESDLSSLFR